MATNESLIVCGTDFSAGAREAAHTAAALAHRLKAKLLLVHAVEDHDCDASRHLHNAANEMRTSGAEIEQVTIDGAPDKVLVKIAIERQAQLIVVGATGRSRCLFTGSIATRVAESASVATLVVRHGGWIARWAEYRHPLRIAAADDFSETGMAALRFLAEFAQLAPCEITVAHVDWPPEERDRLGLEEPIRYAEPDAKVECAMQLKLRERTRSVLGERKCAFCVVPSTGHIDASFLKTAAERCTDLLVVGTHHRGLAERMRLGSVSRAVLAEAHVNVLVVPPPALPVTDKEHEQTNLAVAA